MRYKKLTQNPNTMSSVELMMQHLNHLDLAIASVGVSPNTFPQYKIIKLSQLTPFTTIQRHGETKIVDYMISYDKKRMFRNKIPMAKIYCTDGTSIKLKLNSKIMTQV